MFEWLKSNPLLIVLLIFCAIVVIVLAFIFVKAPKGSKKDKKNADKKEEGVTDKTGKSDKPDKNANQDEQDIEQKIKVDIESINKKVSEVEEQEKQKHKTWKEKHKREVTQVFERKQPQEVKEYNDKDLEEREQEFLRDKQFVKTSKKVSKIAYVSQKEEPQNEEQEQLEQFDSVQEHETEAPVSKRKRYVRKPKEKRQYFDKSKRLSKTIQADDFDDMFKSHVSDDYLDIDVDRHLDVGDTFSENLFARASKMLANSGVKVSVQGEDEEEANTSIRRNDKDYMQTWAENRRRDELARIMANEPIIKQDEELDEEFEDDVNLDAKNLLMVDSVMHRKKSFKNKR